MGGGSSYSYTPSPTDVERLEGIARREISQRAPPQPRRRVFLSFKGEDKPQVDDFRSKAKDQNSDIDFIDYSLNVPFRSENAEYIKRGIRERIKASSVTVVLVGEQTHESEWVDWEIRESISQGKGVIAVSLPTSGRPPVALADHGISPISINHESEISQAIQSAAENRSTG
jgi:hypothetical protein